MEKESKIKLRKPTPEEVTRVLRRIARESEKLELKGLGLTPELEREIQEKVRPKSQQAEKIMAKKEQAQAAAEQWVADHPRYRIKYVNKIAIIENIDHERLDARFIDFLISQAAEAKGGRGMRFFEEEKIKKIKTMIGKRNIIIAVEDEEGNMVEFYFQQGPPFKLLRARQIDEEEKTEDKFNF